MSRYEQLATLAEVKRRPEAEVFGFAILRQCEVRQTSAGKPFANLLFADTAATIAGKIWDDAEEALASARELERGAIVKFAGHVGNYQGSPQITVHRLREAAPSDDFDREVLYGDVPEWLPSLFCKTLVFDIETVPAHELRALPPTIVKALTAHAERHEMEESAVMGLSPYLGKVVSLAFGEGEVAPDEQSVSVLAVPPDDAEREWPNWVRPLTEPQLLSAFWALAGAADLVVTYNGRGFDVPFLAGRSLVHKLPVQVDLLSNRYSLRPHLDLFDLLSQRGRGPSNLDVVCWALDIQSPKGAMDGSMVAPAYARGEILEIAEYNREDVRATTSVYQQVRNNLLQFRADF